MDGIVKGLFLKDKLVELSLDPISENMLIQNARFFHSKEKNMESILDNITQKPVFQITENQDIAWLDDEHTELFISNSSLAVVYKVNRSTGYIIRVSHMILKWSDGTMTVLLEESPKSYYNVLMKLRDNGISKDLMVKHNGELVGFMDLNISYNEETGNIEIN